MVPQPLEVQDQLVKGEDLTLDLEDATPSGAAHLKCIHLQFGHFLHMRVISCSPYSHSGLILLARKLHLLGHPGQGQRRPVVGIHEKPLQHHLFEFFWFFWSETCTA